MTDTVETETATFGAGCFWGVEETFRKLPGVLDTAVGYAGGTLEDPSYEQVCRGNSGHAEVVELRFDPARIRYEQLLEVFWSNHDPTTVDRQGPDIGHQYRSVVFVHSAAQRELAEARKRELDAAGRFRRPIVTEIVDAPRFFRAEEFHQRYLEKRGQDSCGL